MKFLKKTAAILLATVILGSVSSAVFAADDDWGDEWETEEVAPVVTESTVSQPISDPQTSDSKSSKPDGNNSVQPGSEDGSVTTTGDYSKAIPLLFVSTGAAAVVFVVSLRKQKHDND